jgi:hypothetical protein
MPQRFVAIHETPQRSIDLRNLLHRGDFRPGTDAAASGSERPEPSAVCPRRAAKPAGRDPRPPEVRFAPQPGDATPCSVSRIVSGRRPS